MRKRSIWLALLVILSLAVSGCGGSAYEAAPQSGGATGARGGSAVAPSVPSAQAPMPVGSSALKVADASGSVVGGEAAPAADRKIIQNAEVELSVKDVDEALRAINAAVAEAGGYVQDNRVSGTREQGRRVAMKVRVPAGSYGSLLELLDGLGEVLNLHQWTNDVTEEYLDLEARIETGEAHLAQLRRLYEQSGTVSEMIELEREIARVTADLESLKGRYNFLANQVAFSTITINLYEPGVPTPSRSPQTLGERMRDSFLFSWNATIDAAENLLVGLVALIPALLFLAVLGGIIGGLVWLILRGRRGRSSGEGRPQPPPSGGRPQPPQSGSRPSAPTERGGESGHPLYTPPTAGKAGAGPEEGRGAKPAAPSAEEADDPSGR